MRHRALRVAFAIGVVVAVAGAAWAAERVVAVESADGRTLTATLWGPDGDAPTLLLLHGCDSDRTMYSVLGEKLGQAGFKVLAPDIPGLDQDHGAADVEAAFDYLGSVAGILGSGCGGLEAIRLATANPEIGRVALLSTPLDSLGERDAMKLKSQLLLIAAKGHTSASRPAGTLGYRRRSVATLKLFDGNAQGQELLAAEPTLLGEIVEWFDEDSP